MPTAVLLVATHHRPKLLEQCILHAKRFLVPEGWQFSITVGVNQSDAGLEVARRLGAQIAIAKDTLVTDKFAAALRDAPPADLYLMTGDDDFHSPLRLQESIRLWEQGHQWISVGCSWYYNVVTGSVARWEGQDNSRMGTFYAFDGELLRKHGWPRARKSADHALVRHLGLVDRTPASLPPEIGWTSMCCQHGKNLGKRKPFPARFRTVTHGSFLVTGYDAADMPKALQDVIRVLT